MGENARGGEVLPEILPIFPLSGVLLLPGAELPLHIFEPRYRAMTRDALVGPGLIGMIQPRANADAAPDDPRPEIYPTGCMGRITECRQTGDGRYHMTLIGICRFRIHEELPLLDGYRRVTPNYTPFMGDLVQGRDARLDRDRLSGALAAYCAKRNFTANWDAIKQISDERLLSSLAMLCPFEASEKQALLEAADLTERGRVVIALLEMALLEDGESHPVKH